MESVQYVIVAPPLWRPDLIRMMASKAKKEVPSFFSNLEAHNFPAQVGKLVRGCASIFYLNLDLFMNHNYVPPYHVGECVRIHKIASSYVLQNDPIAVHRSAIVVHDDQALSPEGPMTQIHLVEFLLQYKQVFPIAFRRLNSADQTAILLESEQVV
jgi:hypothetical protein